MLFATLHSRPLAQLDAALGAVAMPTAELDPNCKLNPDTTHKPPVATVRNVMKTPVHTLSLDDFIMSAKQLFDRHRFHHAVVIEKGKLFGVVSDRDLLKAISPFVGNATMERAQDQATLKKRIHQIVSRQPITIDPEQTVTAAARTMFTERVSCLPVVDKTDSLLGIVTARDLMQWLIRTEEASESGSSGPTRSR